MANYKLIASDLDGTLFNSKVEISPQNQKAIKALHENGVFFAPSSGRTLCEIPEELVNNPYIRFVIYSNGSSIYDKETGETLLSCIDKQTVNRAFDILEQFEIHVTLRHGGQNYGDISTADDESCAYLHVQTGHRGLLNTYGRFLPNFREFYRSLDNVEMISVFFHNDDERIKCKQLLEESCDLMIASAMPHNLEICSASAGKGNALLKLGEYLGIDRSAIIAVGDSENDIPAIKTAGLGLAMENGCEDLKKVADEVVCDNNSHVVEYILNKYL
jgi:Cof subfamily protein (haloacid dehalogenase superfamily)